MDKPDDIFEKAEITLRSFGFDFTEELCGVCDQPATDATFQKVRVHARCGPPGTINDTTAGYEQ